MKFDRRTFIKKTGATAAGVGLLSAFPSLLFGYDNKPFNISLAEWSLHKALNAGEMNNLDFPVMAKNDYGINAIEYVSSFFKNEVKDKNYLKQLKQVCADNGVKSLLIMVDGEGQLGNANKEARKTAVENHYKWVNAAVFLGCHSIRVNAGGQGSPEELAKAVVDGLGSLTEYGAENKINIIVENHGGYSSNGKWLSDVISKVNNPYCGTLPDFGNFNISGTEQYDRYKGIKELMPYAKGVSAKSYDFDDEGNETMMDFYRILNIVKESGYKGYIGIEYEGSKLSEHDGILATKALLEKVMAEMQ
ncbi:sugar phosphate isomerase/epimerase family protein [Bacteroidota bacterium]